MRGAIRAAALTAVGSMLVFGGGAGAQDAELQMNLYGGFTPDPQDFEISVMGTQPADAFVRGCPGYVGASPTLNLHLEQAYEPLHFYLYGEDLSALVMRGPDGIYRCSAVDERAIARVHFTELADGEYLVWPAAGVEGAEISARLHFSEWELRDSDIRPAEAPTAAALEPARLATVRFDPDSPEGRQQLAVGPIRAEVNAAELVASCAGYVDPSAADVTVEVTESLTALSFYVESTTDTVLMVLDPAGSWHCDDDTFQQHPAVTHPAVTLAPAVPGSYQLLVGGFSSFGGDSATVWASDGPPLWSETGDELSVEALPAYGFHALPADGTASIELTLSGDYYAAEAGPGCAGQIDAARPDAVLTLDTPEPQVNIFASSGADTTLLVVDPRGAVNCDDDTHGFDPAVSLYDAPSGNYAIWVGAYGGSDGETAQLSFTREAFPWGSGDGWPDTAGGDDNPWIGRDLPSALAAFEILTTEEDLDEILSYARLEEEGPRGFTLYDVVLRDPFEENEPITIRRLRVSDLDLDGLSATGEPEHFAILVEGVNYAAFVAAMRNEMVAPLPQIDSDATLSFAASLLPRDGDASRSIANFMMQLDEQFGFSFNAVVRPGPETMNFMGIPYADVLTESVEFEFQDFGFLRAFLTELADEEQRSVDALIIEGLNELRELLEPIEPGGIRAQLFEAMSGALMDLDRPGAIRFTLTAAEPMDLEDLFDALIADMGHAGAAAAEISYQPLAP